MTRFSVISDEQRQLRIDIEQAATLDDISLVLERLARQFSFTTFSVFSMPVDEERSLSACILLTNCPSEFFERYDALGYATLMPILQKLREVFHPVPWCLGDVEDGFDPQALIEFRQLLDEFNISAGLHFPVHFAVGSGRIVSFGGHQPKLMGPRIEELNRLVIEVVGRLVTLQAQKTGGPLDFTALERYCLRQLARGLEAGAISSELRLRGKTVQYLLASIRRKLQASSPSEAVAKAIRLGIIS